jgi:hypothetical protein
LAETIKEKEKENHKEKEKEKEEWKREGWGISHGAVGISHGVVYAWAGVHIFCE